MTGKCEKFCLILLSNAFKHVPDKGEISILTSTTPDQVVIAVKDSGNGISKEEQERIFDRFYQADNRNKALPCWHWYRTRINEKVSFSYIMVQLR